MVKYENGKIYKIVSENCDNIYIGSTAESRLCRRLQKHLSNYRDYLKGKSKSYCKSFDIFNEGNYKIILIENCPCKNKDELRMREQYWLDNTDNKVNKNNAIHDKKEYDRIRWNGLRSYQNSWGGDIRANNNNLLKIDVNLFA
jgi:hypothetical protein